MINNLLEPNAASVEQTQSTLASIDDQIVLSDFRATRHSGKYRRASLINLLKTADVTVLLLAGFLGYFLRFGFSSPLSQANHLFIYLSAIVTIVSLHLANGYRSTSLTSLNTQLSTLFVGGTGALFVILACGFLSHTLESYSRLWLMFTTLIATVLLLVNRIAMTRHVRHAIHSKKLMESIVIVGANEHAEKMIATILDTPYSGVNILGVFDDRVRRPLPPSLCPRLLGSTDKLLSYIRSNHVDRVVVALPWVASDRINALLKKLRTVPVRIDLVPNDVVWQFPAINMERLGNVPVLTVANGRIDEQGGLVKRMEDLAIASLLLVLTSPLLLFIALLIRLDSKGPVLFKQRRHGYNNQIFEVYKFRSMKMADAPSAEITQATRNDPRITRIGKFLRRSSLDELPQLFNVLMGHMSIVGPRPHAVQHNMEYGSIISEYFARHNVKPGITGWAQVNGLRGETNTTEKMHRRVDADLYYIEHWSLLLDFKIILLTGITVWFQDAAY
jgi:Undecaprenyl-phosphate glucose phosphotransferase